LLYATRGPYHTVELGYLPSPDGRWLLVWDAVNTKPGALAVRTAWHIVSLPGGAASDIGETDGMPWLLPYWQDRTHLLLEGDVTLQGDREIAVFDVEKQTLSRPLPKLRWANPPVPAMGGLVAQARLAVFAQRHYARQLECLTRLSERVPQEVLGLSDFWLDLTGFLRDTPENIVLRTLGIPDVAHEVWGGLRPRQTYPQIACSIDGNYVALAWIRQQPTNMTPAAKRSETAHQYAASVDVIALAARASQRRAHRVALASWGKWGSGADELAVPPPLYRPGSVHEKYFRDLRWSQDGHYLSFTRCSTEPASPPGMVEWVQGITVLSAKTWAAVAEIPGARNAFVVPAVGN
jgi:hypothetical protein